MTNGQPCGLRGFGWTERNAVTFFCTSILSYVNRIQIVTAATLSFRAPSEFAEQTKSLANLFNMPSPEYLREAVREKNERMLKDRMTYLSKQLSSQHLLGNEAMDASSGDGLE